MRKVFLYLFRIYVTAAAGLFGAYAVKDGGLDQGSYLVRKYA